MTAGSDPWSIGLNLIATGYRTCGVIAVEIALLECVSVVGNMITFGESGLNIAEF